MHRAQPDWSSCVATPHGTSQLNGPYSVHRTSFPLRNGSMAPCSTVQGLLHAIEYGWREPLHAGSWLSPNGSEPSRFVPSGCSILHHAAGTSSAAVQHYDSVHVVGDSLSRHMMQAVRLLQTGDWVNSNNSTLNSTGCVCDGQFAEWPTACRRAFGAPAHPFHFVPPPIKGPYSCSTNVRVPKLACPPSAKRTAIWLQGGLHCAMNATKFLRAARPVFEAIDEQLALCRGRYTVFVEGAGAQSPEMDRFYPHQALGNVRAFNDQLRAALRGVATFVDFVPLTLGAQRSDGLHMLTEGNVAKADVLLELLALDAREKDGGG